MSLVSEGGRGMDLRDILTVLKERGFLHPTSLSLDDLFTSLDQVLYITHTFIISLQGILKLFTSASALKKSTFFLLSVLIISFWCCTISVQKCVTSLV